MLTCVGPNISKTLGDSDPVPKANGEWSGHVIDDVT